MKRRLRNVFYIITILALLLYIPAILGYKISPGQFWPIGILGIGFFYIFLTVLLLLLFSFFVNKKWSIVLFLLLLAGIPMAKNVLALQVPSSFDVQKPPHSIRLMQWNCQGLVGISDHFRAQQIERRKIVQFISTYQPDIICIQDFSDSKGEGLYSNISLLADSLHYPYHVFSRHFFSPRYWGDTWSGTVIFSRIPFEQTGKINFPGKKFPESIVWADINLNGKTTRVGTTHFQSMYLHDIDKQWEMDPCYWQDSLVIRHGSLIEKLRYFQRYHLVQAASTRRFIDSSQGPFIFTGDLNSVPSSYVYKQIKGDMKDAFLEKNFGLGRTYHSLQPALRIDYIFHNTKVRNLQTKLFRTSFSDHDPLIMDFEIESSK